MDGAEGKVVDDLGMVEEKDACVAVVTVIGANGSEMERARVVEVAIVNA